jgi:hypothetical protein
MQQLLARDGCQFEPPKCDDSAPRSCTPATMSEICCSRWPLIAARQQRCLAHPRSMCHTDQQIGKGAFSPQPGGHAWIHRGQHIRNAMSNTYSASWTQHPAHLCMAQHTQNTVLNPTTKSAQHARSPAHLCMAQHTQNTVLNPTTKSAQHVRSPAHLCMAQHTQNTVLNPTWRVLRGHSTVLWSKCMLHCCTAEHMSLLQPKCNAVLDITQPKLLIV